MQANINRDTKKRLRPFAGHEFNPFAQAHPDPTRRGIPITRDNIKMLKKVFCNGNRGTTKS